MAKGRRDVELVVRARNEASKAVDAITSALDSMTKAQASAAKGAKGAQTALSQFGSILDGLAAKSKGASAFEQVTAGAAKAGDAVVKLDGKLSQAAAESARLAAQVSKAEAEYQHFSAAVSSAEANLARAKASTKDAKSAQADLNAELRRSKDAYAAAADAHDRDLVKLREQQQLVKSLAKQGPSNELARQQDRLSSLQDNEFASRITKTLAGGQMADLESQTLGVEVALGRMVSAEKRAGEELTALNGKLTVASTNLGTLKGAEAANAVELDRWSKQLAEANAELKLTQSSTSTADAAIAQMGTTVRGKLLQALKEGTAQLQAYKAAWQQAQNTAGNTARLSRTASSAGNDSAAASFDAENRTAVQAAGQAKQAYLAQQQALQVLRTSIREAGTDVQALNVLFNADTASAQRFRGALQTLQTTATTTAPATRQVGSAARETAQALDEASNEAGAYEQSLKRMGASGRETLSMWSRIKGEVIALTLSYVGLYGAMDQLRGAVDTFNKVQGAMNQLKLATGTTEEAGKQFEWLRGEANRLGFSYVELTKEYSKFLVSVQNSPQLKPQAQQIFTSFMEAGRVLNLTSDQITGVMNALVQMVGKGAVSMEELRQQMADQGLLGVFNMLADAMHLTTDELSKMISTGNLASSEAIPKLAQQMSKVFGPGVLDASKSLTAEMARFENTVSDAQLAFANGGFADALASSLKDLNEYFASEDGKKFFEQLGAAAGIAVKALALVPKNMDLIVIALSAMVGIKAVSFITDLNLRFKDYMATSGTAARATQATTAAMTANAAGAGSLRTILTALRVSMVGVQTSTTAAGVATAGTATKFTLMRAAVVATTGVVSLLRAGLAALGGPVGIAITAITYAISAWATSTDDATAALDRHSTVLDKIRQNYQAAKGDVKAWSDEVKKQSLVELQADQNRLQESLKNARSNATLGFGSAVGQVIGQFGASDTDLKLDKQLGDAMVAFREGTTSAKEFRDELTRIAATSPKMVKYVDQLLPNVDDAVKAEESLQQIAAAMKVVNGTATDAEKTLAGFKDAADDLGAAVPPSEALDKALESAEEKFGAITSEAKKMAKELKAVDDFQTLFEKMNPDLDKTSARYQELIALLQRARQEIERKYNTAALKDVADILSPVGKDAATDGSSSGMSTALLRKFEGFRSTPYWDVNAFRAGYGSDTVTLADGSVQKIVKGMQVSVEDANRDLTRRVAEFQQTIQNQIGTQAWQGMSPQQQASLTSVSYNYGSLPKDIVAAVKTGSSEGISKAILSHATDNNGVNAGRRQTEAAIFSQQGGFTSADDAEKQLQAAKEYHDTLKQTVADETEKARIAKETAIAQATAKDEFRVMSVEEKESTVQKQIALALDKESAAAKKKGTELTAEEKTAIEARVRAHFEEAHALDEINAKIRQREAQEKLISSLQSQRQSLTEQIKLAEDQGNSGAVGELKAQLAEVNAQLLAAIQNMIALWQQAGKSPEAAAAIQQFTLLGKQIEAANTKGREFLPTGEDIDKSLATAFGSTAIDSFVSKIQQGQSVMSALGDTIREVFADFLLNIAKAIAQQAIFNALSSMGFGKGVSGLIGGLFHSGGVAGETTNRSRAVSPMWFANAARYHGGGVAGLKPGEVPAILEEGERIRTVDQERALQERLRSGGDGSASPLNVKVVNALDAGSFMSAGMSTVAGERAIMNFMTNRKGAVKRALGI